MQEFDFDYWANLAKTNPAEFEKQRLQALQEVADSAPVADRPALNALVTTLCAPQQGTPMERALNAQTLMGESLGYLQAGWTKLAEATSRTSPLAKSLKTLQAHISTMQPPGPAQA